MEARDENACCATRKQLAKYSLLIIDELGFVPLSKTGAELLFEVFSQRYERGSILVTSNLPFDEWTEVFGSERLTGALLDRLTHHVHILEMNGESYRLKPEPKKAEIPPKPLTGIEHRDPGCPGGSTGTSHAASLRVSQSATRSSAGPSYGLPGQPATPRMASHQVG